MLDNILSLEVRQRGGSVPEQGQTHNSIVALKDNIDYTVCV